MHKILIRGVYLRSLAVIGGIVLSSLFIALLLTPVNAQDSSASDALALYDANGDGEIDTKEYLQAVEDLSEGEIDHPLAAEVARLFLTAAGVTIRDVSCSTYDTDEDGCVDPDGLEIANIERQEDLITEEEHAMVMACPYSAEPKTPTPTPTPTPIPPTPTPTPIPPTPTPTIEPCVGDDCGCVGDDCGCVGDDCGCVGDDCPCVGDDCPCTGPDCGCSNRAPQDQTPITDAKLVVGGSSRVIGLSGSFRDPDNDTLRFEAAVSPSGIAAVAFGVPGDTSAPDDVLTIEPRAPGVTTVTVTAYDGATDGTCTRSVEQSFKVTVFPDLAAPSIAKSPVDGAVIRVTYTLPDDLPFYYEAQLFESTTKVEGENDLLSPLDAVNKATDLFEPALLGRYTVGIRACTELHTDGTDRRFEDCWEFEGSLGSLTRLASPSILDVTPLALRMAMLTWTAESTATTVEVEAKAPNSTWGTANGEDRRANAFAINLDAVVGSKGLGHEDSFEIRVRDKRTASTQLDGKSRLVTIIDTPITAANGHSPGTGQAKLSWIAIEAVLGDSTYAKGTYSFRYRKSDTAAEKSTWRPTHFASGVTVIESDLVDGNTIGGEHRLDREEVYAIQLKYTPDEKPNVYAARDVYVWPSSRPAATGQTAVSGEFVAGFPLRQPHTDATYAYRICRDTFPSGPLPSGESIAQAWSNAIEHAFSQWDLASDELLTTEIQPGSCTDYTNIVEELVTYINDLPSHITIHESQVRVFLGRLANSTNLSSLQSDDEAWSEIKYLNFQAYGGLDRANWAFNDLPAAIGLTKCVFDSPTSKACTEPNPPREEGGISQTVDMFLNSNRSEMSSPPSALPGGNNRADRDDVLFNSCPPGNFEGYQTLVHEVGHVFGIGGTARKRHPFDPTSPYSAMTTDHSFRCSPHPLDVLAINALYQKRSG